VKGGTESDSHMSALTMGELRDCAYREGTPIGGEKKNMKGEKKERDRTMNTQGRVRGG